MEKSSLKATLLMLLISSYSFSACESDAERADRIAAEEAARIQRQIELTEERRADSIRLVEAEILRQKQEEEYRKAEEARIAEENRIRAIQEKYGNNSLSTGATPYSRYFGGNSTCTDFGCSEIKVRTKNSDVLVTIKSNDEVVRHAFIKAGASYTFSFPNGTYQPFFYYGKGWYPEKEMNDGQIKGGFLTGESFGKDDPQILRNAIMTYELFLQPDGNFSQRPSNSSEAF